MLTPQLISGALASKPKQNFGLGTTRNRKPTNGVAPTVANGLNLQKRAAPVAALTNNRMGGTSGTLGTILKGLPEIQTSNPRNPAFDPSSVARAVVNARLKR